MWSSGQSSWLQIQRSGFDSRRYQIFEEIVGLERGPLSLVSTIEELLEIKSSDSGLESREYDRRDPSRWQRGTIYPQKLAVTSPISCGRSVGMVRSLTHAMELLVIRIVQGILGEVCKKSEANFSLKQCHWRQRLPLWPVPIRTILNYGSWRQSVWLLERLLPVLANIGAE
jgi:hypothetical protein